MTVPAKLPKPNRNLGTIPRVSTLDLHAALLADARCPNTASARRHDIIVFGRFLNTDPVQACALFVANGRGQANALALAFRQAEQERSAAPASINRRLATLRRLVALARRFELIDWQVDVDDLPVTSHRNTRGPGDSGWRALWAAAVARGNTPKARRDRALLRLLHCNALRRTEAIGIDYPDDVDLAGARIRIKGKGSADKIWLTIPPVVVDLVREWLDARGRGRGPLFTSHPRVDTAALSELVERVTELRDAGRTWRVIAELLNAEGSTTPTGLQWTGPRLSHLIGQEIRDAKRMDERAVNHMVGWMSDEAGIERKVLPHALRHQSITRVLDLTNGNVRAAQKHARHAKPETTLKYDDNRTDAAGDMARLLGADD